MARALCPTFEGDLQLPNFALENGGELPAATLRYAIYGTLNASRTNAVLVCHALSGSARVGDWWSALFGEGGPLDIERDCVICANVLGSCYGSSGPTSTNPLTGKPFAAEFPLVTIRDMVRAQAALVTHLEIQTLRAVIGGSIGGMQTLQWAIDYPERVENCVVVGATRLSAMALALNHLQRQAIFLDPNFQGGAYGSDYPPAGGLALARGIAMCSYKSTELFEERFARRPNRNDEDPNASVRARYDVAGYLDHQGGKFNGRFDANTYVTLTKAMDTFDYERGYESEAAALRRITARVLLIGISSDWLFPAADVFALGQRMQSVGVDCRYAELVSSHGHDAFLAEPEQLFATITPFLNRSQEASSATTTHAERLAASTASKTDRSA